MGDNKTEKFINRAKSIHGDKYDYSKSEYKNNHTKICIICRNHGEFWQTPRVHLRGSSCSKCSGKLVSNLNEFIENSTKTHNSFYNYNKFVYNGTFSKGIIICPIHGEFLQSPHDHLKGVGCPVCGGRLKSNKKEFIVKSNKIHNNLYNYDDFIYINSKTKGIIKCPLHGKFNQAPNNHLHGQGCPICGNEEKVKSRRSNETLFAEKSKPIHGDKYNYSKFVYKNNHIKGIITCPIHGDFLQTPNHHLHGQGCPTCGSESCIKFNTFSNEEIILKLTLIHNNFYNYSKVDYKNAHKKITIICPIHGEFLQKPYCHLNGQGCPFCIHRISKPEIAFMNYLNIKSENRQFCVKPYKVDGFMSETNTICEFLGDYYHGNPNRFNHNKFNKVVKKTFKELYDNTFKKFDYLNSLGYTVKYIWELDWNRFTKGLDIIPNIIDY